MAFRVLIPQDITDPGKDYLRENGCEAIIGSASDPTTIAREAADCDAILARTARYDKALLCLLPRLQVIGRHGIGVDNIDVVYCEENGIHVTYAPLSNSNTVAEYTMMQLLCCARNLVPVNRAFLAGDFEIRNRDLGTDLEGKVLGIIGLGRIGRLVASKAALGFGMRIIGYDPFLRLEDRPEGVTLLASREELFREADFVTVHIAATPETRKSIGRTEFRLMKRSAVFINASRGEVVNENDLAEALRNGVIRGAGIDVFDPEPPARDNPLLRLDNVVATPHNAALTREAMDRMGLHAAMGIVEVLQGREPSWGVNRPVNPRCRLFALAPPSGPR